LQFKKKGTSSKKGILAIISVANSEPRAEEQKLKCLPELAPKLKIAIPAPFYRYTTDVKKFYRKNHGC
jgi:hypothetical protein